MKKSMVRLLSLMLCLITLLSLLPMTALAATPPGKPTNLSWEKENPGFLSFRASEPYCSDFTGFQIKIYKDDKKVKELYYELSKEFLTTLNGYVSVDLTCQMDLSSGTYHFTVKAMGDSDGSNSSATATSKDWMYKKPSSKVPKPTNVHWDWPFAAWDQIPGGDVRYQIGLFYSENKNDEKYSLGNESGISGNEFKIQGYMGTGYYSFRVRTMSSDITEKYHSDWVEIDKDYYFKLAKPTVTDKSDAATGKPKLSWKISDSYTKEYIEKYEIYCATSKDGEYKKVKTTTKTSFLDEGATAGKVYYYKVRGVTGTGAKTSFSSAVGRYCDLPQPKVKGTNVSSSGKPKLSWGKISGAEKYYVYRATSENGNYEKIKSTTSTSYTDSSAKAGKKYYYKVKAIHAKESANSAYSEPLPKYCDLARPDVSIKLNSSGDPKLSWDKVSGAKEYAIYRASSKDGTYKKLDDTTSTSFTDKTAKAGKTYYYKVKAIHSKSSANSAYSSVDYIKAK